MSASSSSSSATAPGSDGPTLELYPVLFGYIGNLNLTQETRAALALPGATKASSASTYVGVDKHAKQQVQTVVLLDRSMSMGSETKRLVNKVFPQVLRRLDANPSAKLTLVAFDDEAVFLQATADELAQVDLRARGGTVMSSGLHMLTDYLTPTKHVVGADDKLATGDASSSSDDTKQHKKLAETNVFSSDDDPLRRAPRELRADDPLVIEVAFVVDCTSSMSTWIRSVHDTVLKLVEQVKTECKTARDTPTRVRVAFVAYRDFCDGEAMRFATFDFSEDISAFQRFVHEKAQPYGGGDYPEDVFGGLDKALKLSWSPDAHTRIALLVADAPCHWYGRGDSAMSLAFPDPFKDPDLQRQLIQAFAHKRINLSFTRIENGTDDMIAKFQAFYYNEQTRKSIKVLQLGQRVERFLPSVLGMIASSVGSSNGGNTIIPITADLPSKQLRLLVLSDGELEDMHATIQTAGDLHARLIASGYTVNAQAVRFFTSTEQPDTRGLSAVLQLNSIIPAQLLDLDATKLTDDEITDKVVRLLEQDGLGHAVTLSVSKVGAESVTHKSDDSDVLQVAPWSRGQQSLVLVPGSNTFWLKRLPNADEVLLLDGVKPVPVRLADGHFDDEAYARIMGAKIDYFMQQLRVLKVVNNHAGGGVARLHEITTYFERLDKFVALEQVKTLTDAKGSADASAHIRNPASLSARMTLFRVELAKKKTSVALRMKEIANDARIGQLNAKQAAEYLRDVGAESKAIAKRAGKAGLDFDVILQGELLAVTENIDELADMSDEDHVRSFYSQETTLGGLRAIAELVNKERLQIDNFTVHGILPLLSMVGVACKSPVGGFVDPMTWRIERMFLSSPLSLSDVLQAHVISGGATKLNALGSNQPDQDTIDNVVPVFDDERIHLFLRKYAPTLLEYNASVGMRRLVTGVPMTHSYTIAAGVWAMVFELNRQAPAERTDLQARMWINLLDTFRVAIGNYFQHVLPFVRKPVVVAASDNVPPPSFMLLNNGITNMISPLMTWIKEQGSVEACGNMGAILRALYTFEIRQAVKRYIKKQVPESERAKTDQHAELIVRKLLGIDIERYKTRVPELFVEAVDKPIFHDEAHVDDKQLDDMINEFWYLDHVCLLPMLIMAAVVPSTQDERLVACKSVPQLDEALCHRALELEPGMSLRHFKLLNIVQAIRYPNKSSRVDTEHEVMKIPDLQHQASADADLRSFVRRHYENVYPSDMAQRSKEERSLLVKQLVAEMSETSDMDEFVRLFRNGKSVGRCQIKIETPSSFGYIELKQALLSAPSSGAVVPHRVKKAAVLLLGRDGPYDAVWNGGHSLFLPDTSVFDASFSWDDHEDWVALKRKHRDTYSHAYRSSGRANRSGHSNGKPSFWARGFGTLDAFQRGATVDERSEYVKLHTACCGLGPLYKNLKERKAAIRAMIEQDKTDGRSM